MKKLLIVLAATLLCDSGASAQVPAAEPSSLVLQSCLLGTQPSTWTTLKLTRDQLKRVGFVQEACKEECAAAGAKQQTNVISSADGNTVIEEVKGILTAEQYRAWVAYCAGSTAPK